MMEAASPKVGKVWKFGPNINTDLILPGPVNFATEEEQKRAVFQANRPGWVDQVEAGDIIVAGANFGIGSGRPAARSLRNLGLGCVLADSINGLFFRNAVNFGFVSVECTGVYDAFEEGQTAELSLDDWTVRNFDTGRVLPARPVPDALLSLMLSGGLFPYMEKNGLIAPLAIRA